MIKYTGKLHRDGIPLAFSKAVESGEYKTIAEWAEKYDITYNQMSCVLSNLRKRGIHLHPYSGLIRVGMRHKKGIVVNIMKKQEWLTKGLNNYENNYSLPHLGGMLKKIEMAVTEFPQLATEIQSFADRISLVSIESRKRLRSEARLKLEAGAEVTKK